MTFCTCMCDGEKRGGEDLVFHGVCTSPLDLQERNTRSMRKLVVKHQNTPSQLAYGGFSVRMCACVCLCTPLAVSRVPTSVGAGAGGSNPPTTAVQGLFHNLARSQMAFL